MHEKEDENSMLSLSTNLYLHNYNTTNIFGDLVAFLSGTIVHCTTEKGNKVAENIVVL